MNVVLTGFGFVPASRDGVWAAINDVDSLKLCIPGCQSLVRESETTFRLSVLVTLGPVRVEFRGDVEIATSNPSRDYRLIGRGQGGLAGLVHGCARIRLADVPGGCRVRYAIETEQTGPLARLGSFFISGVARTLSDQFIANVAASLTGAGSRTSSIDRVGIRRSAKPAVS